MDVQCTLWNHVKYHFIYLDIYACQFRQLILQSNRWLWSTSQQSLWNLRVVMLEQTDEHLHSTSTGQCFPQWSWIFLFCFINLQMDLHLLFQKLLPCPYSSCQKWIKQSQSHLILYLLYEQVLCKGLLHLASFSPWDIFISFFF